jgi:hypothetical protein
MALNGWKSVPSDHAAEVERITRPVRAMFAQPLQPLD